jgi:hypothetical protein
VVKFKDSILIRGGAKARPTLALVRARPIFFGILGNVLKTESKIEPVRLPVQGSTS